MINQKIKVYLISNINPSRHAYLNWICSKLDSTFEIFKPHEHKQYDSNNSKIEFRAFHRDKIEMDKAQISLVIMPLFGRDCASEIGYSRGIGNCVIAWVEKMETKQEKDWLNDWMVKGFIDYIITPSKEAYGILCNNPLIFEKERFEKRFGKTKVVHLLNSGEEISEVMRKMLKERKNLGKKQE